MKELKLFEVRDRLTCISAIAVKLIHEHDTPDGFLMGRVGYRGNYVLFGRLDDGKLEYDIFSWRNRTMQNAHDYVSKNWNKLKSGDVIDVEYILEESNIPKKTDRI